MYVTDAEAEEEKGVADDSFPESSASSSTPTPAPSQKLKFSPLIHSLLVFHLPNFFN